MMRGRWSRRWRPGVLAGLLLPILWQAAPLSASPAAAAMLGANKFDLMLDYVAPSPPPDADPDGYRRVRRAMAKKAIADARDAGLGFFRVAVTGYGPTDFASRPNDLALWQNDPPRFWAALDAMADDLDAAQIRLVPSFVWNITQFPALGGDSIAIFVRDPEAASRRLLAQFLRDFIARYKDRRTILFYELGNEMNLLADLAEHAKNCRREPCVWGDFTTAEMTKFAGETAALIKSLDPSRGVTSGYSLPRPAAAHLERRPDFAAGGPDWTPDTAAEFEGYLLAVHQPFDIISIHVYPDDQARPAGRTPGATFDPIREAARAARAAHKQLFIGEFGDAAGATPFITRTLDDIVGEGVDFAAIWVWEFYQSSTYETRNTDATRSEIEPGYDDGMVGLLVNTAQRLGTAARSAAGQAPRVVLTWPLPCTAIDRPIDLAAVASDGTGPVKAVDFLIDGEPIAVAAAAPYRTRFDPAGRGSRRAEIEARATTASGITASFRSPVRLNGDSVRCDPSH